MAVPFQKGKIKEVYKETPIRNQIGCMSMQTSLTHNDHLGPSTGLECQKRLFDLDQ